MILDLNLSIGAAGVAVDGASFGSGELDGEGAGPEREVRDLLTELVEKGGKCVIMC